MYTTIARVRPLHFYTGIFKNSRIETGLPAEKHGRARCIVHEFARTGLPLTRASLTGIVHEPNQRRFHRLLGTAPDTHRHRACRPRHPDASLLEDVRASAAIA